VKREPQFHVLPRSTVLWNNILPGDVVICPGTMMWKVNDFENRTCNNEHERCVVVQRNPLIVIGIIDEDADGLATFIVFSITMGVLMTKMFRTHRSLI